MTTASNSIGETDSESVRALQIIESMPGFAWSADSAGQFTYVSPKALAFLGNTSTDLNTTDEEDEFGWRTVVHPDDYECVAERWRHCLRTGEHYDTEHRLRGTDGVYRWFRNSGRPSRDSEGRITQWYGTTIDIEDQKQAEATLRDREQELSQLVDMVPSHLWRLTSDGEPIFFNRRMIEFIGMDVVDLGNSRRNRMEDLIDAFVHPDDAHAMKQALAQSLTTGQHFVMRYRLRRTDGVYHWMSSRAEPLRDHVGRIVQWYGLCHDIDDQVKAEEAVRESEQQLQGIIDAVPVHIWSWTPSGDLAYVSKRYLAHLGLSEANFEDFTRVAQELVHPDDAPGVQATAASSLASGDAFSMRYRRLSKDGTYRWMEGRCEPLRDRDGTILHWYGVSIDIDDQVRAEEALRTSKRQLEQMIDALPVNILSFSPSGEMTYASKRYLERVGIPPHIRNFDTLARDVAHPEDFPVMFRRARDGFAAGTPFVNRFRRREKDGVYRWIEARAHPLRDTDDTIVQWYIAAIDIEEEMHAQQALRESERTLRQLIETLPALIYCAAPDGKPTYRSQQLTEFLGFGLDDKDETGVSRLVSTLDAIIHPDDLALVREKYGHSLTTGEPYALRHRLRRSDGEYRWVETRAAPMRNDEGAIVQWNGVCIDIDSEVRTQEELRLAQDGLARASQAAGLAELSASIAHEVNQPLAAIVANSHACHHWLSAEPANMERAKITVERIIRDANGAADIVSRIRALFKQSTETRVVTPVSSVITEIRELLADEVARRRVHMEVDIADGLPPIALDRVQIQQVLINLIRNGMEAMGSSPGRRELRLRVRFIEDAVRVELSDSGPGIELSEKIFEPFFTTKERGMGMGLAICRSIIESHGGRLWAENNTPHGATFVFALPVEATAAA